MAQYSARRDGPRIDGQPWGRTPGRRVQASTASARTQAVGAVLQGLAIAAASIWRSWCSPVLPLTIAMPAARGV
ncbi:hypothetical protein [Phenylobacterium sp.]|uniref:hypothetical protein n=1 Tax=Phenylobacterium sp. TaxID=1871053 RepID=UPI00273351B8|nr:hypothetical protein [Phenylobacterium sp.]MDP3590762.1 hypothetical protein [Phenylobacterium sp.]